MAISKVVVVDGNNLIVRIDRGVAGRGVTDVEPVEIDGSLYLVFTFSDGTTETVGPVGTIQYIGQAPIVVAGSTISLSTVPVNLGGTGQITANAGFNALAPTQTGNSGKYLKTDGTNSAWDLLDISTADITGTLPIVNGGTGQTTANASFNALAPSQATNTGKYLKTDGTNTSWDLLDISTADITGTLAITNGGTGATTASGARTNLGLGTIATQDASAVAITGGSITGITDLAVADGGTGASTAAGARTNLNAADQATTLTAGTGLSGGGDLSANRTFSITNTGVTAASYGSASNTLTATVNAQGQLTALAATPIAIANTQISGLGTISTQNANAVAITGGSITGITDLAVADGGTGASDAAGARTNLNAANQATTITAGTGLSGGGDLSANRTIDIANTTVTAGSYGSASNTLTATVNAQGQLTALAATPIAIANTQVSGLGTLSTQNSNAVTITGGSITGITDLAIADGGTGASNAADARSNLGLGSAAVLNAGVALGVATLDAGGTVPLSQIPASIQGGVSYQGAWNASTNTPTLVSSVGSKGFYYVVSVAGNTNLNGVTDWLVGDWAIYNGTAWEKIDNTDQVASVNGYTGVVVLSNTDVGAPPTSLTISAGTGLSGGGNLTTNRTLSIANTTVTAAPYGTASAVPTFTVNGQGQLTAATDVTIAIANTQVSGLGTLSTQNANSVAITGGSITGITDLAVADGGTGASNATDARSNLSAAYNAITISAGTGLTGGGDLTANRTLAIDSSVVTLTGTQTLTNKTLTSPLVNEILDTNGNEILGLSPTASATDFVTVKNGIGTGVPLHIYADGPSTNIGLHLQPKGSGLITISDGTDFNKGIRFRSSGSAASAVTLLDAVSTAGRVVTLPDATTTLVGRDTTDTLTNKTIAFASNTFSGSLAIANGGTGQATANAAFNALAPSQTGNSGKYLTTDGTDTSWASNPLGTVTSVAATVPSFLSIAGSPITTSGTLAISLSGTALPTTSGGTGLTSFTANGVAYASSSSALATGSALTFDGTLLNNTGVAPKFRATVTGGASSTELAIDGIYAAGTDLYLLAPTGRFMSFYANNAEQMRLTSTSLYTASGINVGIGTSLPSFKLDVNGTFGLGTGQTGNIGVFGANSATADTYFRLRNTAGAFDVGTSATGHYLYGQGSLPLQFFTNATERGRFSSDGTFRVKGAGTAGSTDSVQFSGSAPASAMALDSSGNVIIGASSANAKLDVVSTGTGTATIRANYNGAVTYTNPHILLQNQNQANGDKALIGVAVRTSGGSGYTPVAFGGVQTDNSNRYGAFAVYVSSSDNVDLTTQERLRVDNNGNLGVGTTNPAARLNPAFDGTSGSTAELVRLTNNSGGGSGTGTSLTYYHSLNTGALVEGGRIAVVKEATWTTTASTQDANMQFWTTLDGTAAEKMRITSAGNVGIGTAGAPLSKFDVALEATLTRRFLVNYDDSLITIKASNNSSNPETFRLVADNFRFNTGTTGSGTEKMRLDLAGNLGIGTNNPNAKATIWTSSTTGLQTALRLNNPFGFDNANTGAQIVFSQDRTSAEDLVQGIIAVGQGNGGTSADGYMAFFTNSSGVAERMRITGVGNVGIATTLPAAKVDIGGNPTYENRLIWSRGNNDADFKAVLTSGDAGTQASVGGIGATYAGYKNFASIQFYRNSSVGNILFFTGGLSGDGSEKARIDGTGNLCLGTAVAEGRFSVQTAGADSGTYAAVWRNSAGSGLLFINSAGQVEFPQIYTNFTTGSAANMVLASSGVVLRSTSSLKYKKNVQNAIHGLAEVLQLRPVTYEGKSETDVGKTFGGLIAEEVHAVGLTEFVQYAEDGSPDALAYGNMVSLLAKAMQEQQAIIESLKARLDAANL